MHSKEEIVVITGASAGVGRALVREYAKHKAKIGLIARDPERLEAAKNEVERAGGTALVLPCDVADAQKMEEAAERAERELGPIQIWHNNAMTTILAPVSETQPEEFKRATEVTYLGCVYGTMAALKRMLPRDRGVIVQTGSALSYRSIPLQAAYCGAKHAIAGFTDSLRCELIHNESKVRVTMVCLPGLNTPQFSWCRTRMPRQPQPVPPIFEPEVAAEALYWAAHHKRREVYVGGSTVIAINGQKIAPGFADWYLGTHGYQGQQASEPVDTSRPGNLFEPVPGNYAARGMFSQQSKDFSLQTWIDLRRVPLGIAAAAAAGLGALLWKKNA